MHAATPTAVKIRTRRLVGLWFPGNGQSEHSLQNDNWRLFSTRENCVLRDFIGLVGSAGLYFAYRPLINISSVYEGFELKTQL
jgi:hypothetical protein